MESHQGEIWHLLNHLQLQQNVAEGLDLQRLGKDLVHADIVSSLKVLLLKLASDGVDLRLEGLDDANVGPLLANDIGGLEAITERHVAVGEDNTVLERVSVRNTGVDHINSLETVLTEGYSLFDVVHLEHLEEVTDMIQINLISVNDHNLLLRGVD